VYEAVSHKTGKVLALKVTRDAEPSPFRRDFEAIRSIRHEHLVRLFEESEQKGHWHYTMELVRGVDLRRYVRPEQGSGAVSPDESTASLSDDWLLASGTIPVDLPQGLQGEASESLPDFGRLRTTLAQIVDAVSALHRAGFVHRDLKPSNILVEPSGRAVVLDLGTAARTGEELPTRSRFVGTPAYMAPEHLDGATPSPAFDWYALGMILYRLLTGARPFHASMGVVRRAKRDVELPPPGECVPGIPEDLSELCVDLLSRDPKKRPESDEIIARLRAHSQNA